MISDMYLNRLGYVLECLVLGAARVPLQDRPLQFQHGDVRVNIVGNPCRTLGQLSASRILYVLLVGEKQREIARARFCTQSCSKVGQLLVNSSPTPRPMGSCRGLLAMVLWQQTIVVSRQTSKTLSACSEHL